MKIAAVSAVLLLFSTSLYAQTDSTDHAPIAKPRKDPKPLSEKLVFGGNFGLQLGNYTNITLSPIVGYRVTDDLVLGGGPTYIYSSIRYATDSNSPTTSTVAVCTDGNGLWAISTRRPSTRRSTCRITPT